MGPLCLLSVATIITRITLVSPFVSSSLFLVIPTFGCPKKTTGRKLGKWLLTLVWVNIAWRRLQKHRQQKQKETNEIKLNPTFCTAKETTEVVRRQNEENTFSCISDTRANIQNPSRTQITHCRKHK